MKLSPPHDDALELTYAPRIHYNISIAIAVRASRDRPRWSVVQAGQVRKLTSAEGRCCSWNWMSASPAVRATR